MKQKEKEMDLRYEAYELMKRLDISLDEDLHKYLREVKGIEVEVTKCKEDSYGYNVEVWDGDNYERVAYGRDGTWEEALESGLYEALEYLPDPPKVITIDGETREVSNEEFNRIKEILK